MTTMAELFRRAAGADPGRPFVTFYDDANSERVELSFATFDNWVAKTANMINEDLAAQPGDRFALLLPTHWQTAVWLVACWTTGMVAGPGLDPTEADHVVCAPEDLERAMTCPGGVVVVRPVGARLPQGLPPGVYDYAAEVPAYPDQFAPFHVVGDGDPAIDVDGKVLTEAELVEAARSAAARWGLRREDRVLTTADLAAWDGLLAGVLAPLAAGASVVLCRNLDPAKAERRVATERITKQLPA